MIVPEKTDKTKRFDLPLNKQWWEKAINSLAVALRDKLASGEHGAINLQLGFMDGSIKSLEVNEQRWWKNDASLTKY